MFLRREAGEGAGAVEPRHAVDHDADQGQVEVSHPGPALRVPVPAIVIVVVVIAELIRAVNEHSRRFHSARRRPLSAY